MITIELPVARSVWASIALALCLACPSGGEAFQVPSDVAVEAGGDLVVTDRRAGVIIRVAPATGDRSILSGDGVGAGAALEAPGDVAIEATGDIVLVDGRFGPEVIVRVDPVTGDRTILSGAGVGAGPALSDAGPLAIEASGDIVVGLGAGAVVRLDPTTGDRAVVSDSGTGTGPLLSSVIGIAVEASGDLVVVDLSAAAVLRIDPATGERTVLSDAGTGAGPAFSVPAHVALEASGDVLVADLGTAAVLRVDPVTGDRVIVSGAGVGAGPLLSSPSGLATEASGDVVVTDNGLRAVLRVDVATGDRTLVQIECPATPTLACATGFARAKLSIIDRPVGKERLIAKFVKGPAITQADLGDPTGADLTGYALCLYDEIGTRVASLAVSRANEICGVQFAQFPKPCWRSLGGSPPSGKGFAYKDVFAESAGISKITLKGGQAGKSKLLIKGGNNVAKGQTSFPGGMAAALTSATSVTMQMIGDNGACFGTVLGDITKQESDLFKAKN